MVKVRNGEWFVVCESFPSASRLKLLLDLNKGGEVIESWSGAAELFKVCCWIARKVYYHQRGIYIGAGTSAFGISRKTWLLLP